MDKSKEQEAIEEEAMFDEDIKFEDLGICSELLEAITQLKYKYPTKIQR